MTYRQTMDFTVQGDVRFLAHSDMLRLFARAAARAGLPVHHSGGFNPHPQISLPLPRSVGVASLAECMVIGLDEPLAAEDALRRLAAQMPVGVTLTAARALADTEVRAPCRVAYRVELAGLNELWALRTQELLTASEWVVERRSPKHRNGKKVDVRPFIETLWLAGEGGVSDTDVSRSETAPTAPTELWMRLRVTPQGTARPLEICKAIGIETDMIKLICRTEVEWQ